MNFKIISLFVLFFLLFLSCKNNPSQSQNLPDEFGTLTGYVYELGTTNPIPNARLSINDKEKSTDSIGYYYFSEIELGIQFLDISTLPTYNYYTGRYESKTYRDTLLIKAGIVNMDFYL